MHYMLPQFNPQFPQFGHAIQPQFETELRSCVKVEVDVLGSRP